MCLILNFKFMFQLKAILNILIQINSTVVEFCVEIVKTRHQTERPLHRPCSYFFRYPNIALSKYCDVITTTKETKDGRCFH